MRVVAPYGPGWIITTFEKRARGKIERLTIIIKWMLRHKMYCLKCLADNALYLWHILNTELVFSI